MKCLSCHRSGFKLFLTAAATDRSVYQFFECRHCSLIQMDPLPPTRAINQIYTFIDVYKRFQNLNPQARLADHLFGKSLLLGYTNWCNQLRFSQVTKLVPSGRLLDVGCSEGLFLEKFDPQKWRLFGLEVNKNQARLTRQKIPSVQIFTQPLEKLKTRQRFDVITLWHVLEHLRDPRLVITKARSLQRKDGWLIIEIPNGRSFYFRLFGKYWQPLLLPEHLHFWTEETIRLFLDSCGYRVEKVSYPGILSMSFSSSLSNLLRDKGANPILAAVVSMSLFPLSVCLNAALLGGRDNLQIIAKRAWPSVVKH